MNYCEDCKKFETNNCQHPGLQKCGGNEPKEKPMENKVIFESEEKFGKERALEIKKTLSTYFKNNPIKISNEAEKNRRLKVSIGLKKAHAEGRANVWKFKKSYAEIIFDKFLRN